MWLGYLFLISYFSGVCVQALSQLAERNGGMLRRHPWDQIMLKLCAGRWSAYYWSFIVQGETLPALVISPHHFGDSLCAVKESLCEERYRAPFEMLRLRHTDNLLCSTNGFLLIEGLWKLQPLFDVHAVSISENAKLESENSHDSFDTSTTYNTGWNCADPCCWMISHHMTQHNSSLFGVQFITSHNKILYISQYRSSH